MELHCAQKKLPLACMITVLKPSELKAATGKVLDQAIERPQYVNHNGVLLVIRKADLVPRADDGGLLDKARRNEVLRKLDDSEGW